MTSVLRPTRFMLLAALALLASAATRAEEPGTSIYQQRNADGSVLLTDRPAAGSVTQRTWKIAPEDPGSAARREAARQNADDVTRRIGQRLDADDRRAQELTLARLRTAEAQARLDADAAQADGQTVWVAGPRVYGGRGWYGNAPPAMAPMPNPSSASMTGRPPTASIVRGIPLRADGFPVR